MKLLHVDSSILGSHSVSRILSAEIVAHQRRLHPGIEIIYRDLAADPLMLTAPKDNAVEADIAYGAKVLDELFAVSILVIGAPMYNFAAQGLDRPAGRTFRYTENGVPESLLPCKFASYSLTPPDNPIFCN